MDVALTIAIMTLAAAIVAALEELKYIYLI